jgi:hypothetical protein
MAGATRTKGSGLVRLSTFVTRSGISYLVDLLIALGEATRKGRVCLTIRNRRHEQCFDRDC